MSVQVCHIQKFKAGDLKGIEIHNRREKEGISHTNPNINWSKTDLNYDLVRNNLTYSQSFKNRINELNFKKAVRKDAVRMVGIIISSDSTFFEKMDEKTQRDFFKKSYEFFCNKYGKENIISACVHNDETTPHMHLELIPITKDNRLSAKELFGRKQLSHLQDEFYNEVGCNFNLDRGEVGSKAKHIDKASHLLQQAQLKERELEKKERELELKEMNLKADILKFNQEKETITESLVQRVIELVLVFLKVIFKELDKPEPDFKRIDTAVKFFPSKAANKLNDSRIQPKDLKPIAEDIQKKVVEPIKKKKRKPRSR